jgi:hypothetical protein
MPSRCRSGCPAFERTGRLPGSGHCVARNRSEASTPSLGLPAVARHDVAELRRRDVRDRDRPAPRVAHGRGARRHRGARRLVLGARRPPAAPTAAGVGGAVQPAGVGGASPPGRPLDAITADLASCRSVLAVPRDDASLVRALRARRGGENKWWRAARWACREAMQSTIRSRRSGDG